ncbi:MAG: SiaB family protein kinase [Bacteroidales bacterium]
MLNKSILSYQGPLSFSTIDWLLSEFKMAADDHDISFKAYKKMISIMIEALENITKYSDEFPCCDQTRPRDFCPTLDITQAGQNLELVTSNPVRKEHVQALKDRIDLVNTRSREELKNLFRTTITDGKFTSKGGAGLGFIEMAKTTGNKLEYSFRELTAEFDLYTFKVTYSL